MLSKDLTPNPIRVDYPGCEDCPCCHNITLPVIKKDSHATGRMCSICKSVVDREGRIENTV